MSPIEDLRGLSASLNKASDELNRILKSTEKELRELNLGVEAWVKTPIITSDGWKEGGEHCYEAQYLGWTKINSVWCMALKILIIRQGLFEGQIDCPYMNEELQTIDPILGKSRDIRAKAVKNIENLIDALREEATNVLEAVAKGTSLKLKQ